MTIRILLINGLCALAALTGCIRSDAIPTGYLEGRVTIGPICPVERFDIPCPVPPEAYAAREIRISRRRTLVAIAQLDSQGSYWIALPVGTYVVDINRAGIDSTADVPKEIRIRLGETVRLDIEIDTGIR